MLLFDRLEDAEDVVSECVFCKKPKFIVHTINNAVRQIEYGVDRCVKKLCDEHCKWDHTGKAYTLDWGDEDHVDMVS